MTVTFCVILNELCRLFRGHARALVQVLVSDSERVFLIEAQLLAQEDLLLEVLAARVLLNTHVKASHLCVLSAVIYKRRVKHTEEMLETQATGEAISRPSDELVQKSHIV